ncbi:MAG: MarR family transcriptional regulator [Chloroflexi bacterium]|nr:MarR family transcriptional regulator [Chloroflexota bacterium]
MEILQELQVIEHALQRVAWTEQRRLSQILTEHDLTLPQFLVLVSIHRRGTGCPIGKLADEMMQSYPTMTGIVGRLFDDKLVVRQTDPDDRRKVVVNLTPAGKHLLERARATRRERLADALKKFSLRDQREFLRLLTLYLTQLEKENEN